MSRSPARQAQITVRVSPEFKAAAEQTARLDSRTLSSLIEKLLRDRMKSVGIDDPDKPPPRD